MLNASEARKRINELATIRDEEEKKKAEAAINTAVEKCDSSCLLGFYASDATVKWLRSLGYRVGRMISQKDGDNTEVSW